MSAKAVNEELLALINATKEHACYFQELGVEHVLPQTDVAKTVRRGTTDPSYVEVKPLEPTKPTKKSLSSDHFIGTDTQQTNATVPSPLSESAVSQENLFGEITALPETIEKTAEQLEDIWTDVGDCVRCPLHQCRTNIVHTEGNRQARLMFVGEAPGADEDAQSRPFVGRAGQLLTKIIEAIGFKREEVLIGNVNRCRPPGNRAPTTEEAAMCKPFLLREIAAVKPEVIVVLGNTAMKNLLETREGITRLRGQFQDYKGIKIMPTFHPAYLLRDPSKKRETWEDLKKVREHLDSTG
jgi:DNA polymerase